MFAVVIPPLDYLRETFAGRGVEVASLDSAGLCALKEAMNLVSAYESNRATALLYTCNIGYACLF